MRPPWHAYRDYACASIIETALAVVNARMANQTRSSNATADQLALRKAEKLVGLQSSPAVRDFVLRER